MKVLVVVSAVALAGADLQAQAPAPACASGGSRIVRSLVGGTIGGWLGFVGAKIHYSDWDDASHGEAAHRGRNQATIGGAVIGAAVGALLHVGNSACKTAATDKRMGREMITKDEITHSGQTGSVYDLVFAVRRNWLNLRGVDALTEGPETFNLDGKDVTLVFEPRLNAYVDNARVGSVDELKRIPVAGIQAVRYFDGPQATYRWGAGNQHGAIEVLTMVER